MTGGRAVVVALALALTACGDDGGNGGNEGAGPTTTTSSTTAPDPTTMPTNPQPSGAATAEAAARGLYDAWRAGDRAAAARVATPTAVDRLFQHRANPLEFHGCEPRGGGAGECAWRYEGGGATFTVERQGSSWVVVDVAFTAD